jgi:hypothetical protein
MPPMLRSKPGGVSWLITQGSQVEVWVSMMVPVFLIPQICSSHFSPQTGRLRYRSGSQQTVAEAHGGQLTLKIELTLEVRGPLAFAVLVPAARNFFE